MDLIHAAGSVCQAIGLPKSVGQVFGYLYMATKPQTLDGIAMAVQISKASASTSVRQISSWGAARTVWVPGARREHYEVSGDLSKVVTGFINDFLKPRFSVADRKLAQISKVLEAEKRDGLISDEEFEHYTKRIEQINRIQDNIKKIAPLANKLF
jgi:DNA-binding transcriptional regulator GbsR (MarR family)